VSAEAIFQALGGSRHGQGFVVRCPVPSHGQGRGDRRPSLSIRDFHGRLLFKCHAGCDPRDVLRELRRRGLLDGAERARHRPLVVPPKSRPSDRDGIRRALALWNDASDPRGTIVEVYLESRGLGLPVVIAGEVIRFHPRCPFGDERLPCMVALFRDIISNEPLAVHRTALTPSGQKVARKMLGPVLGAAIKLDSDADVTLGLVLGEGLETGLAARQIGFRPVWALGSVGAVAKFPVLPGIEGLTILREQDDASAKAVQRCGNRWAAVGREVIVASPRRGSDVNDSLNLASAA
jgi:hypothetical protein